MHQTLIMAKTFMKIFSKDRQALFFTLFFPVIFMTIFYFAGGEEDPMEVGVVDHADNAFSADFIAELSSNPLFNVTVGDEEPFKQLVVEGDMIVVLVLPEEFQDQGESSEVTMLIDRSQARQEGVITTLIDQELLRVERELRNTAALFSLKIIDVQARSQDYITFLIPGLLGMMLMQICIAGSGYNIVEYRRKGILKRLFVTPIRPRDFIGGLVIARMLIAFIQLSCLLLAAVFILGITIEGSLLSLLVVILIGLTIFLSLGFYMGSIAKTQQSIMLLGNLITMPQMFLSGIFFSIESMPEFIQPFASLLPLSFLVTSLREIIVNGLSLIELIPNLLGLFVWLVLTLFLAIKLFVWKEVAA